MQHLLKSYGLGQLDYLVACPHEVLHQFLIGLSGLYGVYIIPSILYEYNKVLRSPDLVASKSGAQVVAHLISNEMLS